MNSDPHFPFEFRQADGVAFLDASGVTEGGLRAVFSTRLGGVSAGPYRSLNLGRHTADEPAQVAENWRRFASAAGFSQDRVAFATQVHGASVRRVQAGEGVRGPLGEHDVLVTTASEVVLAISIADCVPIYILDPVRPALGLAHAGWRGTLAGAGPAAAAAMATAAGTRPADCIALLGPSIGPCCYEVDESLASAFERAFGTGVAVRRQGRVFLDLWTANRRALLGAGFPEARVLFAGICTACRRDLFYSHRAEGGLTGRMAAVAWIT